MANNEVQFTLGGSPVGPFKEGMDIRIKMSWGGNIQPIIDISETTFINEHIPIMQGHLDEFGPYKGLDFSMQLTGNGRVYNFPGFIDMTEIEFFSPVQWRAKIRSLNDIDTWAEKFQAVSYGFLAEKGMFSNSEYTKVPVVIHKKFDALEVALASLGIYVIVKDIYEHTRNSTDAIVQAASVIIALNATAALILKAIGTIIYHLAYYALMVVALINFTKEIDENIVSRKVYYKGITLRLALSKACEYFGLSFDCPASEIPELDRIVYLPSKTDNKIRKNTKDEGLPNASDFGYTLSEMVEIAFKLFNAKHEIQDGKFIMRPIHSTYWQENSINTLPSSIEQERYSYNSNEMMANRVISFQYDFSDYWTLPNERKKGDYSKGTNYQVICDFDNGGDKTKKLNKGLDDIQIPLALGKRRDKLSFAEEALKILFKTGDELSELFGGKSRGDKININKGCLQISDPSFNTAKLIYLDHSGYIPANHREYLSAKAIENHYHFSNSFVRYPKAQHLNFKDITIPFDFTKFINFLNSPYFKTENDGSGFGGKEGRMFELTWALSMDSALVSYYIEEEYNKTKLTETFIEA